jgi:hypothetical protein
LRHSLVCHTAGSGASRTWNGGRRCGSMAPSLSAKRHATLSSESSGVRSGSHHGNNHGLFPARAN